ncbi:SH3 domain-containing protein [Agaribacterium haliotis]|uniref:SH3 domain-containing protein n=1 Tax=Agaribacterium haliotis TaxID=2013869 RepID=UPI0013040884|nr:SH3 domain-containing protein [Agaribacterium haliotis]
MALTLVFNCAYSLNSYAIEWNPLNWQLFAGAEGIDIIIKAPFAEIRTGPGRGYPVTHVVERGEKLHVDKSKTDWYRVHTEEGLSGWVHSEELTGAEFAQDSGVEAGKSADFRRADKSEHELRRWELGLALGDFSGARATTLGLQYHMTANLSAELKYTQAFGNFSNIKLYSLNAIHQPFPDWRFSPFFTLGSGLMQTFPNSGLVETEDREDTAMTVGGGLFIYASRNFMLRTEYNHHTVLTSRPENDEVHEWKAGFSVFF